jgi:hypothetical protein
MKASLFFGALLLMCGATTASAVQWPNPANPANPVDTLRRVQHVQDASLAPLFAATGDTVWGIAGIVTGFDTFPTGFAVYIQNSDGSPFSGVDVFTGGSNYKGLFAGGLQRGDSLVVSGRLAEFAGETELAGFNPGSQFSDPLPAVRRISQGNALPPFHIMTTAEAKETTPTATGEPWEGALVRIPDKVRVARLTGSGAASLGFGNMLVVDSTCTVAPCDSVLVDGATLSFYAYTNPALGTILQSVQGIYKQSTPRGYRLMLRDANDAFDNLPPRIVDAYSITQDSIEVVFDRPLTQASAENTANYSILSSLGPALGAKQQVERNKVHLLTGSTAATCANEQVTVNGLVRDSPGNPTMTSAVSRTWANGICPIANIQAPGASCPDRSTFAGSGSAIGATRVTTRGVSTLKYGSTSFLQTAAGGLRSGLQVFAAQSPLDVGRQYTIVTQIQEFFTETQGSGTLYIKDEGPMAPPAPFVISGIGALRDSTCDLAGSITNLEDVEGMLVQVQNVKIVEDRAVGQSFGIAGPDPGFTDSILVDNNVPRTFDPSVQTGVNVTGVFENASSPNFGSQWRLQPRDNNDITTPITGVGGQNPAEISFAVSPNPARLTRVTFALPKRDHVQIAVYDLAGRRRALLADGEYPAGTHSVDWNGKDLKGEPVGSGVYFYKLTIGGQTFNRRGILLN